MRSTRGSALSLQLSIGAARDLARTSPVCLLDRQFTENLPFGQAKISRKTIRTILTFGGS